MRRARRCLGALILCATLVVHGGCGAAPTGPETSLRELAAALRRGDARASYALMSARYRERVSLEELERLFAEQPDEILDTAAALEQPLAVEVEARAVLGRGEGVLLERADGGWRVVSDVLDYYGRDTPREAVRSFVRAIERQRYDVVLALLPAAERERLTADGLRAQWEGPGREEVERLASALREGLEASPIQETGDRAVMPYGDRFRVVLVREAGLWCIEDPE